MKNFNDLYNKMLSEMTAASVGVGSSPGPGTIPGLSGPNVYRGDVRAMGIFQPVKKRKKKSVKGEVAPVIRRTFPGM
jgi:hypothetical protein